MKKWIIAFILLIILISFTDPYIYIGSYYYSKNKLKKVGSEGMVLSYFNYGFENKLVKYECFQEPLVKCSKCSFIFYIYRIDSLAACMDYGGRWSNETDSCENYTQYNYDARNKCMLAGGAWNKKAEKCYEKELVNQYLNCE